MKQRIMELLAAEKGEDLATLPFHRPLHWECEAERILRILKKIIKEKRDAE